MDLIFVSFFPFDRFFLCGSSLKKENTITNLSLIVKYFPMSGVVSQLMQSLSDSS